MEQGQNVAGNCQWSQVTTEILEKGTKNVWQTKAWIPKKTINLNSVTVQAMVIVQWRQKAIWVRKRQTSQIWT